MHRVIMHWSVHFYKACNDFWLAISRDFGTDSFLDCLVEVNITTLLMLFLDLAGMPGRMPDSPDAVAPWNA
jgi:hypothetical protein